MLMTDFVDSVESDLTALGEIGGTELATAVDRIVVAIRPALRARLLESLDSLIQEFDERTGTNLTLTLDGNEVRLERRDAEDAPTPPPSPQELTARIALRVPDELKRQFERSARSTGISVNSWIVRTLDRSLRSEWSGPRQMKGTGRT
jgi:hypothetical protein